MRGDYLDVTRRKNIYIVKMAMFHPPFHQPGVLCKKLGGEEVGGTVTLCWCAAITTSSLKRTACVEPGNEQCSGLWRSCQVCPGWERGIIWSGCRD